MAFEDGLDILYTIGTMISGFDSVRMPILEWNTLYEAKGTQRSLRAHEVTIADVGQIKITHKMHLMINDLNGEEMELKRGMIMFPTVPFDYASMSTLPRYEIAYAVVRRGFLYYVESREIVHG